MPAPAATYLSSLAIPADTVPSLEDWCERHGVGHVELTSSFGYYPGIVRDLRQRRGRTHFLLHNYFPPPERPFVINLASDDVSVRRASVEHCRACLDLTVELGSPHYSVHAGFARDLKPSDLGGAAELGPGADLTEPARRFVEQIWVLAEHAGALGVDLLIENNVLPARHRMNGRNTMLLAVEAEETLRLLEQITHPRVGLLVDVAHLRVSAEAAGHDPVRSLRALRPWVRGLHLSENDGLADTNESFGEDAWFMPELEHFTGHPWVIETRRLPAEQTLTCLALVERWRHRTAPGAREDTHRDTSASH